MEDNEFDFPFILGTGWGTTLSSNGEKPKKIKKNPVGFHVVQKKVKK